MPKFRTIEVSDPRYERDGLRNVTFKSPALRSRADLTLFVPPGIRRACVLPLVILLHGVYGSHWSWAMKGGAHRTAARLIRSKKIPPMILAMPSDGLWGDGSGYVQHRSPAGANYEKYIVEEVPALVAAVLESDVPPAPVFISGLSMGGFGALRLAAKFPDRFAAVSAHSSITDFSQMREFIEEPLSAYGKSLTGDRSVIHWMLKNRKKLPPIRFDCGSADILIAHNRKLRDDLTEAGVPHIYAEFPGGHEWPYWEKHLAKTLLFFGRHLAR